MSVAPSHLAIALENHWLNNTSYNYPKNQLVAESRKMLQSIKGVYKDGAIKLAEIPENIEETQVIVTFLEAEPKITKQIIYFGMFTGAKQSNQEDFKIAEFRGDFDDSLDW